MTRCEADQWKPADNPQSESSVDMSTVLISRSGRKEFALKKRGGLGVRGMKVSEKKGEVVGAMFVNPDDEILLISAGGVVIRTPVSNISVQGRDAGGVTVMSLDNGDEVSAVARLLEADEERFEDGEPGVGSGADTDIDTEAGAGDD